MLVVIGAVSPAADRYRVGSALAVSHTETEATAAKKSKNDITNQQHIDLNCRGMRQGFDKL